MTIGSVHASIDLANDSSARTGSRELRLDVTLVAGAFMVVTGPSLSGKTRLLHYVAGWEQPRQGEVTWNGADTSPPSWSQLTVIPQAFAIVDELTVLENVTLARRLNPARRPADRDQLDHIMEALGLDRLREREISEVSVGERQRIMVARALADRPDVILADEPVVHQDRQHADAVLGLLSDAVQAGSACLLATRHPTDIARVQATTTLDLTNRQLT